MAKKDNNSCSNIIQILKFYVKNYINCLNLLFYGRKYAMQWINEHDLSHLMFKNLKVTSNNNIFKN